MNHRKQMTDILSDLTINKKTQYSKEKKKWTSQEQATHKRSPSGQKVGEWVFNLISIKEIEIKQWNAFYSSEIADLNKMSLPKVMEGSAFGEQFDLCQNF